MSEPTLHELIERVVDGQATADELAELEARLLVDAAACDEYLQRLNLDAALREQFQAADAEAAQGELDELLRLQAGVSARRSSRRGGQRRWWTLGACAVAVVVAIGALFFAWPQPQHRELTLTSFTGEVLVESPQGTSAAVENTRLFAGQQLVVKDDASHAVLRLGDGTRMAIDANSRVELPLDARLADVRLVSGSMEVDVQPQPDDRPLRIATSHGLVRVLGTRFRLYDDQAQTRLELESGNVALVRLADGQEVNLSAGTFAVIDDTPAAIAVRPLPPVLRAPLWSLRTQGSAAAFRGDGQRIVCGSTGGEYRQLPIVDTASGEVKGLLRLGEAAGVRTQIVRQLEFASDDSLVALVRYGDSCVWNGDALAAAERFAQNVSLDVPRQRYDREWGELPTVQMPIEIGQPPAVALAVAAKMWAGGSTHHNNPYLDVARLADWSVAPEKLFNVRGESNLTSATLAGDGSLLAIGARVGDVNIYDTQTQLNIAHWRLSSAPTSVMAFSPDNRSLATFNYRRGVELRELDATEQFTEVFPARAVAVSLAFSRDGKFLAGGFQDGTVRVWSLATKETVLIVETGHGNSRAVFSPDGGQLATIGNGRLALWRMPW